MDVNEDKETHETLQALTYKSLQALAKKRGVKANLSKGLLIERLLAAECTPIPSGAPVVSTTPLEDPQHDPDTPQEGVEEIDEQSVVPPVEVVAEAAVEEDPPQQAATDASAAVEVPEVPERRKSERLSATPESSPKLSDAPAVSPSPLEGPQQDIDKPQEHVKEFEEDEVIPPAEVVAEAAVKEVPPQLASGTSTALAVPERRKSERLSAMPKDTTEKIAGGKTPRLVKGCSTFVTKRPTVDASSRFERAHQNMFAAQQSIERYATKTPKKGGVGKENTAAGRPSASKGTASRSKPAPRAPMNTPGCPTALAFGSGVKSGARGTTVASKPCTLVVQRSKKKPTQVKEFRLSSNTNRREGFAFKPYSGPVRPIASALAALADKTPNPNVRSSETSSTSLQRPHNSSKAAPRRRHPIKAELAASKSQAARRLAHQQSGKNQRANKMAEGRATRT